MARAYVIVGASLAGATAAITLREEDADGTITLIGAEREPPYERPPLSKAYLRGEVSFDQALVRPSAFYAEHAIETIFGTRVISIGAGAFQDIITAGGSFFGRKPHIRGTPAPPDSSLTFASQPFADHLECHGC